MFIIANGKVQDPQFDIPCGSFVIAANGGARHCLASDIFPDVVIGDFDSLSDGELSRLKNAGSKLIRYPTDKDETDLELALTYAIDQGGSEITLLGLLGGRWDMSFANIFLLASNRFNDIRLRIIDGNTQMFILRGGDTLKLCGNLGETVSIIALSTETSGITYAGLEWPLDDASIEFGSPRGVSNRMSSENASIRLNSGVLLVIIIHQSTNDPSIHGSEFKKINLK
jgi:thiamine pyrophosphokinase